MASEMTRLRVKELLREKGWTTKVLAEKTGMSESYLTHIKNSTRRWNQDSLERLAIAFDMDPLDIFAQRRSGGAEVDTVQIHAAEIDFVIQMAPVMSEIPAQPSAKNNKVMQITSGCKDQFVPVQGISDDALFALRLTKNAYAPVFEKNDLLVVAPSMNIHSGDLAVVEYGEGDSLARGIFKVTQQSDFLVLESVNGKQTPVSLVRGKDQFRFIGRVIARHQNLA